MKRAFRDAYNTELGLLRDRAREFAQDYPGLADHLGGLVEENLDPTVAGLMEGSAFLSARVQVQMQEQYRVFTRELLDQIFPDALAPTPSVMLARATIPAGQSGLEACPKFAAGEYLDARYSEGDKRVSCRFTLAAPLTLWPLAITATKYHDSAGPVDALGQDIAAGTKSGLVVELSRVGESGQVEDGASINELTGADLTVHFTGPTPDAAALYEQVFCDLTRISLRWHNRQGDPVFTRLPPDCLEQIGFTRGEKLFPHQKRLFDGYARLREFFTFPRKFLGFRLTGLDQILPHIQGSKLELVFEFSAARRDLAARLEAQHLTLNAAPAVNLFEEVARPVRLDRKRHEYIVTPSAGQITQYELHGITEVAAYYSGQQDKQPVLPLYAVSPQGSDPRHTLYYTARRKPRRLTTEERRIGASRYRYLGSETFIALYEPPEETPVQRLQVKAMCSNRHLPEYLPIAQGQDDFYLCEDQTVKLTCVAGPTPPRESLVDIENGAAHRAHAGETYWRLLSYLSLNHFGIDGQDIAAGRGQDGTPAAGQTAGQAAAGALREMLSLFADLSDNITEAQLSGILSVETRPITRSLARPEGYYAARGLEIRVTLDEDEFESAGIILLGAVLDRFFAEYAAVNSFAQTVILSQQRGQLKSWPPRTGSGPLL